MIHDGPLCSSSSSDSLQSRDHGLSEAETIQMAKWGNPAAFERLYQLYSRRVFTLCLRMVKNPTEAEDLTQEAFLQVFRKIGTFRGESAFSTWLHRLAVNIVLMRVRKKKCSETSLDGTAETDGGSGGAPKEFGERDLRLAGSIDRLTLERFINQLPAGYKAIFVLHDVLGYEHNEVAEILGCSIGNSKSQLHKARLRLRDLLQHRRTPKPRRQRTPAACSPAAPLAAIVAAKHPLAVG